MMDFQNSNQANPVSSEPADDTEMIDEVDAAPQQGVSERGKGTPEIGADEEMWEDAAAHPQKKEKKKKKKKKALEREDLESTVDSEDNVSGAPADQAPLGAQSVQLVSRSKRKADEIASKESPSKRALKRAKQRARAAEQKEAEGGRIEAGEGAEVVVVKEVGAAGTKTSERQRLTLADSRFAVQPEATGSKEPTSAQRKKRAREEKQKAKKAGIDGGKKGTDLTTAFSFRHGGPGESGALGTSPAPSAQSRRNSSLKDVKEVSSMAKQLADGFLLVTARCHENDPVWGKQQGLQGWASQHPDLPAPVTAAVFGKDLALGFRSEEEMTALNGTKVLLGAEGHFVTCKKNRQLTQRLYSVLDTSTNSGDAVMAALKVSYPKDNFSLFRGVCYGATIDDWAVEFEAPPSTIVRQIEFAGTDHGKKGNWTSRVVAAVEKCGFCNAPHTTMAECFNARFFGKTAHAQAPR